MKQLVTTIEVKSYTCKYIYTGTCYETQVLIYDPSLS